MQVAGVGTDADLWTSVADIGVTEAID